MRIMRPLAANVQPYPEWPVNPYIERDHIRRQFSAWKRDYKRSWGTAPQPRRTPG